MNAVTWMILLAVPIGAGLGAVTAACISLLSPGSGLDARKTAYCDRAVETFMATKDLVELERAKTLIDRFNCAVASRLSDPAPQDAP